MAGPDKRAFQVKTENGETRTLESGKTLTVGSGPENDLVVGNEFVAAQHAKLVWVAGKQPKVADLGSRCGTFLNGIRLFTETTIPLKSGTIHVGPVELQLLFANREALLTGISDRVSLFSDSGPEFKGTVDDQDALKDVMRRLETAKRTGTLVLKRDGRTHSELTFYMGKVMGADIDGSEGLTALKTIMASCDGAAFSFLKEFEPKDQQLGHWPSDLFRVNA